MEKPTLSARQKGFRIGILLAQALILTGCFKDATLNVQELEPELVGSWFHQYEASNGDNYEFNSVYLTVDEDGNASYGFCEFKRKSGSISTSTRTSVYFPDARLIGLEQAHMTIETSVLLLNIEHDIDLEFGPFTSSEGSYLGVSGYTLSRTDAVEPWVCPDT